MRETQTTESIPVTLPFSTTTTTKNSYSSTNNYSSKTVAWDASDTIPTTPPTTQHIEHSHTGRILSDTYSTGPWEIETRDAWAEEEEEEEEPFAAGERPEDMASWSGHPDVKGSSEAMRMLLLSVVHVGITFTWGVEMTYCTPYLLNLGLTKSQTSMVWVAGPLSGLITQPIIGAMADESTSKWGRRRPYIVVGSCIVACSLVTLGWTKEIVGLFIPTDTPFGKNFTIFMAVLALYVTDFAINAVMSAAKSLSVDTLSISKQQTGAAWINRMGSLGHIVGYAMGAIDLPATFGTLLGNTQFKQLTLIAALGILLTSFMTCYSVTERVLISVRHDPRKSQDAGSFKVIKQIYHTVMHLPPRIQAICWSVFWAWIGWFPFMIYSSTWVAETYFRYDIPETARESTDALGDMGRIGSYALTVFSLVTFVAAWVLPFFVRAPDDDGFTHRPPESIAKIAEFVNRVKPSLLTVWVAAHLIFAGAMFCAPFALSFRFATALVCICGVPWAVNTWAPTAFLGVEVNNLSSGGGGGGGGGGAGGHGSLPLNGGGPSYRRLSNPPASAPIELRSVTTNGHPPIINSGRSSPLYFANGISTPPNDSNNNNNNNNNHHPSTTSFSAGAIEPSSSSSPSTSTTGELSGIYFGILNMYITVPQFIGTIISTIVFSILEPGKSPELATDAHPSEHHATDGVNAIAVCLFIGAVAACGSAVATRRLGRL